MAELKECYSAAANTSCLQSGYTEAHTDNVRVANDLSKWVDEHPEVIWKRIAPIVGCQLYPLVFDVIDAFHEATNANSLLSAAARMIAPTWEELCEIGLTDVELSSPRFDDVQGSSHADVLEQFISRCTARALAELGPGHGLILDIDTELDPPGSFFLHRLAREASLTGFMVGIRTTSSFASWAKTFIVPNRRRSSDCLSDRGQPSVVREMLALCPQGMPIAVLQQLTQWAPDVASTSMMDGTNDGRLSLPRDQRHRILAAIPRARRRQLHDVLGSVWPAHGWNYLRRAQHVARGGNIRSIFSQHTAVVYGYSTCGRRYLMAQLRRIAATDGAKRTSTIARINLARIFEVGDRTTRRRAARLYAASIDGADPETAAGIIFSIVSTLARERQRDFLTEASKWLDRGVQVLGAINDLDERSFAAARFLNARALIDYHLGRNCAARRRLWKATRIVQRRRWNRGELAHNALMTTLSNLAKLLYDRFGDFEGARRALQRLHSCGDQARRDYASFALARIAFDRGEYETVVAELYSKFGSTVADETDEQRELLARIMLAIALGSLGRELDADSVRQRILDQCYLIDTDGTRELRHAMISMSFRPN